MAHAFGPVHADLFRDNVMFEPGEAQGRERLTGFFDFYFAGCDTWLFDVAVCLNDWCIDLASGRLDETAPAPSSPPTKPSAPSPAPSTACCRSCCCRGGHALLGVAPV